MSRLAVLVIDQIADRLASQNDKAGSDRLLVAKETILSERMEGGSTPSASEMDKFDGVSVDADVYRRIALAIWPDEELPPLKLAEGAEDLRDGFEPLKRYLSGIVASLGYTGDPAAVDVLGMVRGECEARVRLQDEVDGLREVEAAAKAEINRLSGEIGKEQRLRQSAENLLTQFRLGLAEALRSEDTTFDALVAKATVLRRDATKTETKPAGPGTQVSETTNGGGRSGG